jgi:hypothetical protein
MESFSHSRTGSLSITNRIIETHSTGGISSTFTFNSEPSERKVYKNLEEGTDAWDMELTSPRLRIYS